jgi:hypothetical protein
MRQVMYDEKYYRIGQDILWIALSWLLFLATQRLLQVSGYPVSFAVWPMGEDRIWLSWMHNANGSSIAQPFWQMNGGNPVALWWNAAFKPLITVHDSGIIITRYLMSLLCAIASYLCIRGIGGYGARWFALATGILCAVFTANGFIDNSPWSFIGALSMSLLCVWAYTRFLDSNRMALQWYGISLVFFALSTYALQSGAFLAVAYLAYASPQHGSRNLFEALGARISRALQDCLAYLGVFATFLLIWKTTALPSMAPYYPTQFSFSQLLASASLTIWHMDFSVYAAWAGRTLSLTTSLVTLFVFGGAVYLVLRRALRSDEEQPRPTVLSGRTALDILVVGFCLILPTILVEASSMASSLGTRWRMVHQFWVPLYVSVVLAVAYLVIAWLSARRLANGRLWAGLVGLAAAGLLAIDFGHNKVQMMATATEKNLRNELAQLLEQEPSIKHFIVKMEPGASWISPDVMSPIYAKTFFPRQEITMRVIPAVEAPDPGWATWWKIQFNRNDEGIGNALVGGGNVPYDRARVLAFDGTKVRSLQGATADQFAGLAVVWERDQPLPSGNPDQSTCSFEWTPSKQVPTSGFSTPEQDPHGPFRWTIAKQANVTLPACNQPFQVEVRVGYALSEQNITQFGLAANGTRIPVDRSNIADGVAFVGKSAAGTDGKPLSLELSVPNLDRPSGSSRDLGVAVRQIKISPIVQ